MTGLRRRHYLSAIGSPTILKDMGLEKADMDATVEQIASVARVVRSAVRAAGAIESGREPSRQNLRRLGLEDNEFASARR